MKLIYPQAQKLFVEAEGNVAEAKKQYDEMLRIKQSELSKHLKEISQKNDQVRFTVIISACINRQPLR